MNGNKTLEKAGGCLRQLDGNFRLNKLETKSQTPLLNTKELQLRFIQTSLVLALHFFISFGFYFLSKHS